MDVVGAVIVFIISWWVSFFCVLPIGVQSAQEAGENLIEGNETGAPAEPMIRKKALWAVYGGLALTTTILTVSHYTFNG